SPPILPSYPTRRSSDLEQKAATHHRMALKDSTKHHPHYKNLYTDVKDANQATVLFTTNSSSKGSFRNSKKSCHTTGPKLMNPKRSEEHTSELQSRFDLV